ncbi:MAG: hypothetical protein P8171_01745 [Candidatus Thiodiazotropha sp.]|jgi:hypothetical protein
MKSIDENYLAKFAARELGPEHFDHRGHLWMAWQHLACYEVDEASRRVCQGIRELAVKFGVPEKFNHTLSEALMRIMAERMRGDSSNDFDAFLRANPDLDDDCIGVLARHYSDKRLNSESARSAWVEPDRLPLNQ